MELIPSRSRTLWTAECPTPQRVARAGRQGTFQEVQACATCCGLGQAALRPSRTAECPTPQRVARAGRQITFQDVQACATCCGLGQAALRSGCGYAALRASVVVAVARINVRGAA